MLTVRQVVQREIDNYLMTETQAQVLSTQELEKVTKIREFGKWALLGENAGLGVTRQIKFQARNKEEMSEWQALETVSDDEGLAIDAILALLEATDRKILKSLYQYGISTRKAAERLRMDRTILRNRRDIALAFIAGRMRSGA